MFKILLLTLSLFITTAFAKELNEESFAQLERSLNDQHDIETHSYLESPQELDSLKEELVKLQDKVSPKWQKYLAWQNNNQWVRDTVDMSLAGEIYAQGWMGPRVSRQIVPDLIKGWLVVDTIHLGEGLLLTGATLAGNILINQVFPYVQLGPIKEKTYVNVRKVQTYEEAILAAPFSLKRLPIKSDAFEDLALEEQISTTTTGGAFIRAGGGIASLIGLELPAHINIGPKSKLTYKGSLKLTVAKAANGHALISIERLKEFSNGIGFGFGVFFEDIVDVPVTIGVNSSNGYFPFLVNFKETRQKISSLVYDIDLKTHRGRQAYQAFLKRDFAFIEEMAEKDPRSVQIDLIKEGQIHSREMNGMVNLIIWRSGFRNIFVEGKFNTTDKAGNRFEYYELESQDIRNKKWFSNIEDTSLKFSALVPSSRHENGQLIIHKGGFVLDSHFFYEDTKTKGEEILEISDYLMDSGSQLRLPFKVNKKKNYARVQIDVKVRIQSSDMANFLNADSRELWRALAYAQGLSDPYQYDSKGQRSEFVKSGNQGKKSGRKKLLKSAQKVMDHLNTLKRVSVLKDKAKEMINFLKKGKEGQLLHKTILEFTGPRNILMRGFVRGKNL